jgi:NADH-quinone oxidoreductase subunit L
LFLRHRPLVERLTTTAAAKALHRYLFNGWGFDWLYDMLVVRPYVWIARANRSDVVELFYETIVGISRAFYFVLSATETGQVQWYAKAVALGAVVVVAIMVFV